MREEGPHDEENQIINKGDLKRRHVHRQKKGGGQAPQSLRGSRKHKSQRVRKALSRNDTGGAGTSSSHRKRTANLGKRLDQETPNVCKKDGRRPKLPTGQISRLPERLGRPGERSDRQKAPQEKTSTGDEWKGGAQSWGDDKAS